MKAASNSDTETVADYQIGYARPPRHTGFQKGRSGNPKGRPKGSKNFATLLTEALDEKVQVTEDGKRRRVSKRELVIKQLVNKSASADLRAIKQLTDIVERVERCTADSPAAPPPPVSIAADEEVIAELKKRIERDIRARIAAEKTSLTVTPADPRDGPHGTAARGGVQEPTYAEAALDSRMRGNDEY